MRYLLFCFCYVLFFGCFLSNYAWGQSAFLKPVVRGALEKTTASTLQQQIERSVSASVASSAVNPTVYRAMLHMEPSFAQTRPAGQRFPANAFLVQINNNGKKEIWGVTTKVLAHSYGPKVILRAKHNGKEIEIPAEVAQEGPRRLSDIALLKVPQELPQEVEALEVAEEYDQTAPVSLYTFNKENLLSFPALHLQKDNGYFLRMDFANQVETPQSIFYTTLGAPIVSNGKAVGVFCRRNENGGYGSSLSMLPYLVKNVTQPYQATSIPFKIKNYDFGEIDIDETIISVLALDEQGRTIGIEFFNKELHQSSVLRFINNLKTNSLRFDIHKANGQNRYLFYSPKHNLHWSVSH